MSSISEVKQGYFNDLIFLPYAKIASGSVRVNLAKLDLVGEPGIIPIPDLSHCKYCRSNQVAKHHKTISRTAG